MWCDYVVLSLPWTNSPRASKRKETKRASREEAVVMGVVDNERAA